MILENVRIYLMKMNDLQKYFVMVYNRNPSVGRQQVTDKKKMFQLINITF